MTRSSLIVPSYNGAKFLPACLDSLIAERTAEDEIIVVDNASTDESRAILSSRYASQVNVVLNERNLGFAGGCNVGLQTAQGQFFVLVNQDVVVRPGWLEALLAALKPSQAGIAGCKLYYPDGRLQHAGGVLQSPQALPDHRGYRLPDNGQWDRVERVDYVTGAAIAIKRAVIDRIGLFDEGYFPAFYEEVDLCFRARAEGFEVIYTPFAAAVHHESTSHEREGRDYHRWMGRGRLRFILKHHSYEQFSEQFAGAESTWLAQQTPPAMREGLRLAYLDALTGLRNMPQAGALANPAHLDAIAAVLVELADSAAKPAATTPATVTHPAESGGRLHRLTAGTAAAMYGLKDMLAKVWHMRRLIEQQREFNHIIGEQIAALQARVEQIAVLQARVEQIELALEDIDQGLIDVDRATTELKHDVAQLSDCLSGEAVIVDRTVTHR